MFDLRDNTLTRADKFSTPVDRLPDQGSAVEPPAPANDLDSDDKQELHSRLLSYYRQELDRQSENRFQMAIDEDYYDNIQWSEDEARQLKERGQAPIVYNVTAQTINWVIGSEKRGRTDFKILPREKEDTKPAEIKTKLLKYLSDVNRLPFSRSRAFEDAIKVGIGWLEDGAQDEDDGEPVYSRYESWRNILHDSASTEFDFSDGRYIFRSKWVDVDVAKALFPGREAQIQDAVVDASLYGSFDMVDGDVPMDYMEFDRSNYSVARTLVSHKRRRVRLIECEYRVPEKVQRLKGGIFKGEIYDENDPRHVEAVLSGASALASKVMMRVRLAHMTVKDLLWEGPSPYRHNRFRFTPIWCYRRGRDNLPYGMIRAIRDIQDDINKRASKALHILSSNKVIMDEGALPEGTTLDEFAEEIARPDAIIIKRAGKELVINAERDLAAPHLDLMSRGIQMIQQVGGVTDELLGRTTNAVSGVAVQKRQEQGSLATNKPFDNLRLAVQMQGELQLSLLEQFVTGEKTFRITNERGTPEFIRINDGLPENEITRSKADFIISEADWRSTMRQAAAEQLMEMISRMPPQVGLMLLDLAVESMDLPNREEIAKRIRAQTGMRDPDQQEPTPEEMQQMQAQQAQQQAQEAMFMAELEGKQADAALKRAKVAREDGMAMKDRVDSTNTAMTAAQSVITMPTIARVADGILQEAGWKDFTAPQVPANLAMPPQPQQVPPEAVPQEQQPMEPPMQQQPEQPPQ
ncbi:MAG: portal protein [Aestuariivirga sp.]